MAKKIAKKRPLIVNKKGGVSSELSITVNDPKLNKGRATNIPSIQNGKEMTQRAAINFAVKSGKKFKSFGSIDKAVSAAKERSASIGKKRKKEISSFKKKNKLR